MSWPRADVWLHGASVGDQRALAPLVHRLRSARPDLRLLITAWTEGGLVVGGQLFPDLPVRRVPLAVAWGPGGVLRAVRPRVVVFEYLELWPAWVAACARHGVGCLVVDGRVGPRSLRIRPLLARAASRLDAFCARSERDAAHARALGVRPDRLFVHGNAKYDGPAALAPPPSAELAAAVGPIDVVVGSLHPDEEAAALPALAASGLRALIAPRYPRRAPALLRAARRLGVGARLRSQPVDSPRETRWVVLDTFGELAAAYALAPVALVGGTFGRRQGQTLVEPAAHGCRVVHGPATANIAEEVAALDGRGAWLVDDWSAACARAEGLRVDPGIDPRPALAGLRGAAERNLLTLLSVLERYPPRPAQLASAPRVDTMGGSTATQRAP